MVMKSDAIKNFLNMFTKLELAQLYDKGMEVQVNVGQTGGTPISGEFEGHRWRGWQNPDTGETWKSFRIPFGAKSDPVDNDGELKFDLAKYAEGIGMTGWSWITKKSIYVAYDFDAMTGHSDKHTKKLTDQELNVVKESLSCIPWVTIRRSTGGSGLHIYVFLEPVPTENHNEHAALARAILGQLSGITGVDFKSKVDTCGGNMWVWHRKMRGTNGLELLKSGERLTEIPPHWRDHLKVIKGERKKVIPFFVSELKQPDAEEIFEQLTGQRNNVQLDDEHKKLLDYIRTVSNGSSWWDADGHMLITHTVFLKEAHQELQLRGVFETLAKGTERGHDHNCFMHPLRRGAWSIRRFSPGVAESNTWEQDGAGWTKCFYNKNPDLSIACRANGGKEHPAGGYVFNTSEEAQKAAHMLGANLSLPSAMGFRKTRLKQHPKDGRLIAEVVAEEGDRNAKEMDSWIAEKGSWKRIFSIKVGSPIESETESLDDTIRHLVSESGKDLGWLVRSDDLWREEPLNHIKPVMTSLGLKPSEINAVLGGSITKPWTEVCRPFQPEYPGDRQWNRNAPQLKFPISQDEILSYNNWNKILNHLGKGLDDAIKANQWAKSNGIEKGADYLKCWIASMFQFPLEPLPYLFFYSQNQDTGKSVFHESIELLLTCGYVRADQALISQGGFNGELQNAVLCVVEETDMKKNQVAYNRIKDWVTSRSLPIHIKGRTPYAVPNTTHWVHASNSSTACPIFSGDTRITMIYVDDLTEKIPKTEFIALLEKEASHFITSCLNLELPRSNDRLNLPVITTKEKIQIEESNKSMVEQFLQEFTLYVPGEVIVYGELFDEFRRWLDPSMHSNYTKQRFGKELPPNVPKGRLHSNPSYHVGNLVMGKIRPAGNPKPKLILNGEYLDDQL